jgi:hypothetical protein
MEAVPGYFGSIIRICNNAQEKLDKKQGRKNGIHFSVPVFWSD